MARPPRRTHGALASALLLLAAGALDGCADAAPSAAVPRPPARAIAPSSDGGATGAPRVDAIASAAAERPHGRGDADADAVAPRDGDALAGSTLAAVEPAAAPPVAAKTPPEPPPIPPSTAVLHVGDSMVPQLAKALRARMRPLGVRYAMRFEQSTFTSTWAGRMDAEVAATQPHLVLITLGGNELAHPRPEAQARFVRRIVAATRGRPCVWITPPLWRDETGIVDVIQQNAAPCRFFETDRFLRAPIERVGDGIHPTPAGGEAWADVFWPWLMAERVGGEQPWALRPGPDEEYAPRGPRSAPSFGPGQADAAPLASDKMAP